IAELDRRAPGAIGISKVSVQTGTSHGGTVNPDGTVAAVAVDFGVHERLGKVAREEYGLAGTVQHGASTLPDEDFHRFREIEVAVVGSRAMVDRYVAPVEVHWPAPASLAAGVAASR